MNKRWDVLLWNPNGYWTPLSIGYKTFDDADKVAEDYIKRNEALKDMIDVRPIIKDGE